MIQVAGDMNNQVAGSNGALKYTPVSGGGLEQMAVPALLVLANNVAPKLVKRGGSTMKIGGKRRRGRRGGTIDQVQLEAANKELNAANEELKAATSQESPVQADIELAQAKVDLAQAKVDLANDTDNSELKQKVTELNAKLESLSPQPDPAGGNMLQQAIVPATLILASNMKRSLG